MTVYIKQRTNNKQNKMTTTMTQDQCFNEMAKVLGFENPEDTGYLEILEKVKSLNSIEEEYEELEEEKEELAKHYKEHKIEIMKLKKENEELNEDIVGVREYMEGDDSGNLLEIFDTITEDRYVE